MKLQYEIRTVTALSEQDRVRMFRLMCTYYENVKRAKFEADLAEKDGVLLLFDGEGVISGFSTFLLIESRFGGRNAFALYSGDTIVDKTFWGQMSLFQGFASVMIHFLEQGKTPLYWFLLTKGIRTYLLLPLYFRRFYPNRRRRPLPYEGKDHGFGNGHWQGSVVPKEDMVFWQLQRRKGNLSR